MAAPYDEESVPLLSETHAGTQQHIITYEATNLKLQTPGLNDQVKESSEVKSLHAN